MVAQIYGLVSQHRHDCGVWLGGNRLAAADFDGINKQSIVSAPLLMYVGGAIYARHEYLIATSPLIAIGMIFSGCLMLLSRSSMVPYKKNTLPK